MHFTKNTKSNSKIFSSQNIDDKKLADIQELQRSFHEQHLESQTDSSKLTGSDSSSDQKTESEVSQMESRKDEKDKENMEILMGKLIGKEEKVEEEEEHEEDQKLVHALLNAEKHDNTPFTPRKNTSFTEFEKKITFKELVK